MSLASATREVATYVARSTQVTLLLSVVHIDVTMGRHGGGSKG